MLTWDGVLNVTETPKSNKQICHALGLSPTKINYQDVSSLTRVMGKQGFLYVTVDYASKNRRGCLFQRVQLNNINARSDEQVAADTNTGAERKKSAHRGMAAKYRIELDALRSLADKLIIKYGFCTTDLLRDRSTLTVPAQLWGCVFRPKRYKAGKRVASSIRTNNGRYITEWRLA
jgi:hypothetical protein